MVTGREAFIILGVIACTIAVFGAICWLAYATYNGRFLRKPHVPTAGQLEALTQLSSRWQQQWPGCRPVGHELRSDAYDRWVRFHSLPDSKRHADTASEYATVLDRHHTMLAELKAASDDDALIAITCSWSKTPCPRKRASELERAVPQAVWWQSLIEDDSDPDHIGWLHLFVSRHRTASELNSLLMLVADGQTAGVTIADEQLTWLYHPYDGGADVIAPNGEARDLLRGSYARWLSAHPKGL